MLTERSVESIRRSERFLGLDRFKVQVNARTILYHREQALVALEPLIEDFAGTK